MATTPTRDPSGRAGQIPVLWDPTNGQPYVMQGANKAYISPEQALMFDPTDPRAIQWAQTQGVTAGGQGGFTVAPSAPGHSSFFTNQNWDPKTGKFQGSVNWGDVMVALIGGAITAGAAYTALGGGAAAQLAIQTATETGSPEAALATAGVTATTPVATGGLSAAELAAMSGELPAGAAAGGAAATTGGLTAEELAAMSGELPAGAAAGGAAATTGGLTAEELAAMSGELPGGAGAAGTSSALTAADNPALWGPNGEFLGNSSVTGATGGSTLRSILDTAANAGQALGAAGTAAGNARIQQALLQQRQDALTQQQYQDSLQGLNTDLKQKQFALDAPSTRENQSVRGDILANATDFSYGAPTMVGNIPVPSSTGGLRPSIFSPATKALGSTIADQNLTNQQAGDKFAPIPPAPGVTPLPGPSGTSNILNTAGTVGNLLKAFGY